MTVWAPRSPEERVAFARSMVGRGRYALGAGGRDPNAPTPFIAGRCDCSGFVAWAVGYDRKIGALAFEWLNTDTMIIDALSENLFYELVTKEYLPGDVVVYPGIDLNRDGKRDRVGHCGVIVEGGALISQCRVVHCQARRSPAVIETDGAPFLGRSQFRGQTNSRWKSRVIRPL